MGLDISSLTDSQVATLRSVADSPKAWATLARLESRGQGGEVAGLVGAGWLSAWDLCPDGPAVTFTPRGAESYPDGPLELFEECDGRARWRPDAMLRAPRSRQPRLRATSEWALDRLPNRWDGPAGELTPLGEVLMAEMAAACPEGFMIDVDPRSGLPSYVRVDEATGQALALFQGPEGRGAGVKVAIDKRAHRAGAVRKRKGRRRSASAA